MCSRWSQLVGLCLEPPTAFVQQPGEEKTLRSRMFTQLDATQAKYLINKFMCAWKISFFESLALIFCHMLTWAYVWEPRVWTPPGILCTQECKIPTKQLLYLKFFLIDFFCFRICWISPVVSHALKNPSYFHCNHGCHLDEVGFCRNVF